MCRNKYLKGGRTHLNERKSAMLNESAYTQRLGSVKLEKSATMFI